MIDQKITWDIKSVSILRNIANRLGGNIGITPLKTSCQIVTNTALDFITGIYLIFRRRQSREYRQIIAVLCSFENGEKFRFQTGISDTKTISAVLISWRYHILLMPRKIGDIQGQLAMKQYLRRFPIQAHKKDAQP